MKAFIPLCVLCVFSLLTKPTFAQVAKFNANTTKGCAPLTVQFQNQGSKGNYVYRWSFGNGNNSTLENPQAIYYQPGIYSVSFSVTDSTGKQVTETKTQYIHVFKNPEADLKASARVGCEPFTVEFTDISTLGDTTIKQWIWDFGDGNTSNSSNPTHTYKLEGEYNVSLVVIDANGCESKIQYNKHIKVKQSPKVDFIADKRYYCEYPVTIQFTDKSTKVSSGDTYEWDFGDGGTSNQKNPSHTYGANGSYTVTLKITKANGCTETKVFTDYIVIKPLAPDFIADVTRACAPALVKFTNLTDPTSGLTFRWNFGDGSAINGVNTEHTYTTAGKYDVTLTANVDAKCNSSVTKKFYISIEDPPEADFTLSDSVSCKVPLTVYMTDKSQKKSSIEWKVGNENLGGNSLVAKTFTAYGEYTVQLVAFNILGCTDTAKKKIKILPLELDLTADVTQGCAPLDVHFTVDDNGVDPATSYDWNFGDGSTATTSINQADHTFNAGKYTVTVSATSELGCEAVASIEIMVGEKTNPSFGLGVDTVCNNQLLQYFNDTGNDPKIDSSMWLIGQGGEFDNFGDEYDGTYETDNDSGTYDIMLITVNNGCRDTFIGSQQLVILPPLAKLTKDQADACSLDSIRMEDKSVGADSVVWHVYQGDSLMEVRNGKVQYFNTSYDRYRIVLIAYNFTSGCIDTAETRVIYPDEATIASMSHSTDLCAPTNVVFNALETDADHTYIWRFHDTVIVNMSVVKAFEQPGSYPVTLIADSKINDCIDSVSTILEISGPTVDGSVNGTPGCGPVEIELTNHSDPSKFSELYWMIDDERIDISDTGTISHTLVKPGAAAGGQYLITLNGIDSNGCKGYESFSFLVEGVKDASIKLRRFATCDGNEFIFTLVAPEYDISTLDIEWDFDDGTTSDKQNQKHIFTQSGIYNVSLTITEDDGCITVLNELIDIEKEKLIVDFGADSLESACPPLFVQFQNYSTAVNREIVSYLWDFGDGTYSVEQKPSKLYLKAGKFTVKLYVEDDWGCKDSAIIKDFILVDGPEGEYEFDKKEGCVPLTVNYTSNTIGADYFEWDMGDGNVIKNQKTVTHTYNQPGRFIPLLILSDTLGCSYTLPPIDTIYVDPYPTPKFKFDGYCFGDEIQFETIEEDGDIEIESYAWEFVQGDDTYTSTDLKPSYTFKKGEDPRIKLTATTPRGCSNTIDTVIRLFGLDAKLLSGEIPKCVGTYVNIQSGSTSDTTIVEYRWTFPWGESNEKDPVIIPKDTGLLNFSLWIRDTLGCIDSTTIPEFIVGDTISPPDPEMLRVSVLNDSQIEIDIVESKIPDFSSYVLYHDNGGNYEVIFDEKNRKRTHYVYDVPDTRIMSHCFKLEVKNTCGLLSDSTTFRPHCAVEVGAKPSIDANLLRWNHYSGWDNISHYEILRSNEDDPMNFNRIASVTSDQNSYVDSSISCHTLHHYKIKAIELNGNTQISFSDTCGAKPIWTNRLGVNELIRASVVDDKYITIDWDTVNRHRMPIVKYVLEKSENGIDYTYHSEYDPTETNGEDHEVFVDDMSYFYRSYAVDACGDTSPFSNFGKTILLKASTDSTLEQRPMLDWSTYKGWYQGVNYYTIEIKNPDGSFTEVGNSSNYDTAHTDMVTNLNQRDEYCYRIIGHRNMPDGGNEVISISNEDCSPVKSLIWIPNAFSPNGDNLNDKFVTPGIYIKEYHLKIYNRWGELVFESFDYYHRWDGTYMGKDCQQDAYMVIVNTIGVDGIHRQHGATVTLLR